MKQEWLEDLLAVIDTGSLSSASRKRFLSQPAFSRRIQTIENHVGAELFDRRCKPMQLKASVIDNEPKIRRLAQALAELTRELNQGARIDPTLVLGCQHAITTAVTPVLVKALSDKSDARIKIRSANSDECHALLLTGQVDIALMYQSEFETQIGDNDFIEKLVIDKDSLIPVIAHDQYSSAKAHPGKGPLNIIRYPDSVFLGRTFNREVLPRINDRYLIRWIAETALTPAALQFALSGVGIAWVPRSLTKAMLEAQKLTDLSAIMPTVDLNICAFTLKQDRVGLTDDVWRWLQSGKLINKVV
ncbi:MAG: LysR family transcriptional regulator [Granulosicoccus sp.]|nr:LysR family transcriptional regulator [Granulosicoccus sp.]